MSVTSEATTAGPYLANGATTSFPFGFRAIAKDDVGVLLAAGDAATIADPAAYTVTIGSGSDGGTVVFTVPPAAETSVMPFLAPAFQQHVAFTNQSAFLPGVFNEAFDRGVLRDLWLRDQFRRALRVPSARPHPNCRAPATARASISGSGPTARQSPSRRRPPSSTARSSMRHRSA
jgi:hypothetical protein